LTATGVLPRLPPILTRPGAQGAAALAASLAVSLVAAVAVVRWDIGARREAFQVEARTAHRLLSQRAAELDATLATLALLTPEPGADRAEARLPAVVPYLLAVRRLAPGVDAAQGGAGTAQEISALAARSRASGHAVVAGVDTGRGQFTLLRALGAAPSAVRPPEPVALALTVDIARWLPATDWPYAADGPTRVRLVLPGTGGGPDRTVQLAAGAAERGATPGFVFAKTLGTPSMPFELQMQRHTGPGDWPWARLVMQTALIAAVVAAAGSVLAAWQRQRRARQRAEDLLRVSQVARLNTLGEMAAGLAHELAQPLTAVLASTQAARRWLDDDPPPQGQIAEALSHAAAQARRASDVVGRLRRRLEQPGAPAERVPVSLGEAAVRVCTLLQPEFTARQAAWQREGDAGRVLADPVALEQILHNLVMNALQAMEAVPPERRRLRLCLRLDLPHDRGGVASAEPAGEGHVPPPAWGVLDLQDSGPGLAPEVLDRLFQPFTSTRSGGLGLGLSLSESLAVMQGGRLSARNALARGGGPGESGLRDVEGAVFTLALVSADVQADPLPDTGPVPP
jgi:signal transduction histidine kinase